MHSGPCSSSSLHDVCVAQWRLCLRSVHYRHGHGGGGGASAADDGRGRPAAAAAAATAALAAAVGGDGPAGDGGERRGAACRPVHLAWVDRPVWADAAADAAATAEVAAALATAADLYAPRRLRVVLAMTPRAPVQSTTVVGDGWGGGGGEEGGGDGEGGDERRDGDAIGVDDGGGAPGGGGGGVGDSAGGGGPPAGALPRGPPAAGPTDAPATEARLCRLLLHSGVHWATEAALVLGAYTNVAAVLTRRLDVAVERVFEVVPAEEGGGGGLGL